MDGREAMAMQGTSPSYYIHGGPGPQPGLHGPIRPMPMSNPSFVSAQNVHIGSGGSSGFQLESLPVVSSGAGSGEPVKRKRGRPRKYGPDGGGGVGLALSPVTPNSGSGSGGRGLGSGAGRRGRGRPPGTGRKQQLASLGEWVVGSAGMGFTPHVISIAEGECIAKKIMAFSQQGPRAVCIISANGAVSTVTLRQPETAGGIRTFEGRFEILCLSGSYLMIDEGGSRNRSGGLSISLASPDSRVIGGGVGGSLIAATPVQVIVGSFLYGGSKVKNKSKSDPESGPEHELPVGDDSQDTTTRAMHMSSQGFASPLMGGWPGSRQLDMRDAHMGIDLTRG